MKGQRFFASVTVSLFLSCTPKAPVAVHAGEVDCSYCHMGVVDLRFNAQAMTKKGRLLNFDSIECLMSYETEHPGEVDRAWLSDALHPGKWIPYEASWILKSEKLPSPMGAFLSAYGSEAEFRKARSDYGGNRLSPEELRLYIQERLKTKGGAMDGAASGGRS